MEIGRRALPDFCYERNRSFTFPDAHKLIDCASQVEKKPNYVVKPILRGIPSLAIKRPIQDDLPSKEVKKQQKQQKRRQTIYQSAAILQIQQP